MAATKLAKDVYQKLLTDISSLYEGARKALIEAYWKIGQRIVEVEQRGEVRAAYGDNIIPKVSGDLTAKLGPGFSETQLEDMRRFYLANRKSRPVGELGWSQHVWLSRVGDPKRRKEIERTAIEKGLSRNELRELVRRESVRARVAENRKAYGDGRTANAAKDPSQNAVLRTSYADLLEPVRGTLYTYRIIQPKLVGAGESELLIDLGFSSYKDLDHVTGKNYSPDAIVRSTKDPEGNYKLSATSSGPRELFTYIAEVEKVVDGDTLKAVVDLGFGIKTRQYLRLRGIDCPEIDTPEGKAAAWVGMTSGTPSRPASPNRAFPSSRSANGSAIPTLKQPRSTPTSHRYMTMTLKS